MIRIGSYAIKHWFPDFPRQPKDVDWAVVSTERPTIYRQIGLRNEYLPNPVITEHCKGNRYASPDVLLTLKISHAVGWDIFWEKHMWDINFLQEKGAKLDKELFIKLYNYWNTLHEPNKRSNLEMSAEDFFNNALKLDHEHDFVHTLLNPVPTYTKVLKDGAEVEVCEEKFNALSHEDKCNLVYEEVELMAWERWPKEKFWNAYSKMLKKFIINHAPLWEAIFIVQNYKELCRPKRNFFKIIEDGLKSSRLETDK